MKNAATNRPTNHDRQGSTGGNTRLASCGVSWLNSSLVFQLGFSAGLTVLCSENPHERQAWERSAPQISEYAPIAVPHSAIVNKTAFNVSIKDFVNYWINDSSKNNGLHIMLDEFVMPVCWLRFSSSDNPIASQRPKLTVSYAVAEIDSSGATTFCTGDSVIFTTNTGSYTYQWFQNGIAIPGANSSSLTAKTSGDYFVVITNSTECTVSSTIKHVNVNPKPSATITALGATSFCNGDSVVLQANSGSGLTYQWLKNNTNISNATSVLYSAKTAGTYKVKVTNVFGCTKASAVVNVSVSCKAINETFGENEPDVKVYPNPFSNELEVIINPQTHIKSLTVFDIEGRLIASYPGKLPGSKIGLEWKQGVYYLQIDLGDRSVFKRVVKL